MRRDFQLTHSLKKTIFATGIKYACYAMTPFPSELKRYRRLVISASLLLGVAGAAVLFFPPEGSPTLPRLLFATMALVMSGFGFFVILRWYQRAAYVVATVMPRNFSASLHIAKNSNYPTLYASVLLSEYEPPVRVAVIMPHWNVREFLNTIYTVNLYVDPSNSRLMAIDTPYGRLWCMPIGIRIA